MLITLEEAKAQLGMEPDETEDDGLIEGLIVAAQAHLDSQFGIVVDIQERSWTFDSFAPLLIIPATPVDIETIAIEYLDDAGVQQQIADFRAVRMGRHVRLLPAIASIWPQIGEGEGRITVTAQAGYAGPDSSDDVPGDIKVAAQMLVAHWYENRESFGTSMSEMPMGVSALLNPHQLRRV